MQLVLQHFDCYFVLVSLCMIDQMQKCKEWIIFHNFWEIKARSSMMACLIELKVVFSKLFHLNELFFFIVFWRGRTIWVKLGTNLLVKLISPTNDCMDFSLLGSGMLDIVSTLLGSMEMPSFDKMNRSNLPLVSTGKKFLGFNEIPYLRHLLKICFKLCKWSYRLF